MEKRPFSETGPEEFERFMTDMDAYYGRYVRNGIRGNEHRKTENPSWHLKGKPKTVELKCDHCSFTTYSADWIYWFPRLNPKIRLKIDKLGDGYVYNKANCEYCGAFVRVRYWGKKSSFYEYWCDRNKPFRGAG